MFRIYFRYNHRNIRCPAVCTVVRNNRCLGFCIIFFNLFDFFFCHIYSTKNKINFAADCLNIIYIFYNYIFYRFRHRFLHFPAAAYCLFICFPCTSWTCCNCCYFKPRVILQQRNKTLAYHTGTAKDTYF